MSQPKRKPQEIEDFFVNGQAITEDDAANAFAFKYQHQLAYCHDQGSWFQFDGSIWRAQRTPLAFHYARELARRLSKMSSSPAPMKKVRFAAGVETFAKSDPVFARTSDFWDRDPFLLGTPDGTVDLRTGRLRPSIPTDNITKATAVSPIETPDCPIWNSFLTDTTDSDPDLIRFLQQMAGYALTGSIKEHALFFVYGPGGNGKGVFLNTIQAILSDYAQTAAMDTFQAVKHAGHPADLAMLRGARLATAQETEEGGAWAEARIKSMTGGDPISARFMRQNFFTYVPQFTLIIVGNHKPALRTVDDAMRRRFNIIPFTHEPKTRDPELPEKLKAEYPAILRWMIEGALDWQKNGLIRPKVVLEATEEYFEDQNTMGEWLEQKCDADPKSTIWTERSSTLFASWTQFSKANGIDPGSAKTFKPAMERLGYKFKKDMYGRWFHGVQLRREHDA